MGTRKPLHRSFAVLLFIPVLTFTFPFLATADTETSTALESRLQILEDTEAIRTLLLDYGRLLDARDFDGYAKLFVDESGEWIGADGIHLQGREAIQTWLEKNIGGSRGPARNHHLLTNPVINIDGDKATALSKCYFVMSGENNNPDLALSGHYEDMLVRVRGRWLFQRRVVYGDIPFTDPLAVE